MAADMKENGISLLVFNGRKDKFRVGSAKFVAHLKELTVQMHAEGDFSSVESLFSELD
ncbi:hypothetical protein H257_19221 [Aphanomyces astaci]|uniref:Uncharacterized protein n=1 Tax=Aphanomyces astaci TaxID=112090 RepID=W4FAL2_APHAT|nr:hypothetical protein H257_19221 [Aphanomyces astaci]ETV63846.1 hypothetical protein H257_19221 [Aphanomyces astaci]|eukprot:XP_009846670.1 hypothetical protein H257_19221 [Aphanomyces astaci]